MLASEFFVDRLQVESKWFGIDVAKVDGGFVIRVPLEPSDVYFERGSMHIVHHLGAYNWFYIDARRDGSVMCISMLNLAWHEHTVYKLTDVNVNIKLDGAINVVVKLKPTSDLQEIEWDKRSAECT